MRRRRLLEVTGAAAVGAIAGTWLGHPARAGASIQPLRSRLTAGRAAHQAVAVPDGGVLFIGGFTSEAATLATCDLYDPSTDAVRPGPALAAARHSHTATPLADGTILLVGGYGDGPLATAELLDPLAGRSEIIGVLTAARAGHVAVPLRDGPVLIAGGVGPDWTFLTSAEIFDPRTATFTPTAPMRTARESHTGTLLTDGRVLIAGGHQGRRSTFVVHQSAEVFDPATGEFAPAAPLRIRRHKHDAVRLPDGRVLLIGGSDERDSDGAYATTEVFDPATGEFGRGPLLRAPRYKLQGTSLVLPDGQLVVTTGATTVETLAPDAAAFDRLPGRYDGRRLFATATAVPGGDIIVAGGYGPAITASDRLWRLRLA